MDFIFEQRDDELNINGNNIDEHFLYDKPGLLNIIPYLFIENIEQIRELMRSFIDHSDINISSHDK